MSADRQALLSIQELMDTTVWTPETLEAIADILRDAGYQVRDLEETETV